LTGGERCGGSPGEREARIIFGKNFSDAGPPIPVPRGRLFGNSPILSQGRIKRETESGKGDRFAADSRIKTRTLYKYKSIIFVNNIDFAGFIR
jgi:hypothetical protein